MGDPAAFQEPALNDPLPIELPQILRLTCEVCRETSPRQLPYDMVSSDWCDYCREPFRTKEMVDHPAHYGGEDNPYEVVKVIKAWARSPEEFIGGLRFNYLKYLARAGSKDPRKTLEDLEKARWYLDYEIQYRKDLEHASRDRPAPG